MYSWENNYTVENPINRYSLGSDDLLMMNADGTARALHAEHEPGQGQGLQLVADTDFRPLVHPLAFLFAGPGSDRVVVRSQCLGTWPGCVGAVDLTPELHPSKLECERYNAALLLC